MTTVQKLQYTTHKVSVFIVFLSLSHDPFLWLVHVPDLGLHLLINYNSLVLGLIHI